jgi:5-hydroxyisourate hydrolase-like protein (transthyretin family)
LRYLDLVFLPYSQVIILMLIKFIGIGFIGLVLSVTTVWAEPSSISGIVKDAKGEPIAGADIRIETKNGERLIRTVKTDAKGRYVSNSLPTGNYRVSLVVNDAVKSSINNTTVESGEPTWLNFDLMSAPAAQASRPAKKGKHWVWLPPFTGSKLPGRWIEVDENGGWAAAHASHEDVVRISGEELQRTVHSRDITRGR